MESPIAFISLKVQGASGLAAVASLLAVEKSEPWPAQLAKALLILALLLAATVLVYTSGGTRFAYVHVTYVAIVAGAALFGFPGGVVVAVLAGFAMGPLMPLDVEAGTAQTTTNWLIRAGFFLLIGGSAGLAFHIRDRQLQQIRRQGYYDSLTNLPNRTLCLHKLNDVIRSEPTKRGPILALSVSVGQLEAIRSSFGHEYADALQFACSERIKSVLPHETKLFHISSGVFMLILMAPMKHAVRLGTALLETLDEPFVIDGVPILPGGHVGLAQLGHHATDALALLRASISAVQDAEAADKRLLIFNKQKHLSGRSALQLMPDLQRAIRGPDEITLHYQPKVDLESGVCTGAEALVRWRHPTRGWISPVEFIPLAEQTALINPLTERVLDIALAQLAAWEQEGLDLTVAVNLSIRNLEDSDFPSIMDKLLQRYLVSASRLEVEVTESS